MSTSKVCVAGDGGGGTGGVGDTKQTLSGDAVVSNLCSSHLKKGLLLGLRWSIGHKTEFFWPHILLKTI